MLVRAAVHKLPWTQISNQVWADMFYLSAYMFLRHKKKGKIQPNCIILCLSLDKRIHTATVAQMTCDNFYISPAELKNKISLDGSENSCRYSQLFRLHLKNFLGIPAEHLTTYTLSIKKLKKKNEFSIFHIVSGKSSLLE